MHQNALLIFDRFVRPHIDANMHVLEIGPDRPAPSTFCERCNHTLLRWTTADISASVRPTYLMPDGLTLFPGLNDAFDMVFAANVLEHVEQPSAWLQQLARVANRGGLVATISPISWPYHEAPVDVGRYYPAAMTRMFEDVGLSIIVCTWLTMEFTGKGTPFPGRSLSHVTEPVLKELYLHSIEHGGPVECAYDCVTIGQKPY